MNVSFNDYYDSEPALAEAESARLFDASPLHLLVSQVEQGPHSAKVIDLGCGQGRHLQWLFIRGWTGRGIDLAENAITHAKTRLPQADLQVKDMRFFAPTPAEVETFDAAIALRTLMHLSIEECQRVFLSVFRALRPKTGAFLLSYLTSEKERGERVKLDPKREVSAFHPLQIESLLKQSGLVLVASSQREETYDLGRFKSVYLLLRRI